MTRLESVKKTCGEVGDVMVQGVKDGSFKGHAVLTLVPALLEIAISLAVIADKMSEADKWA